MRGPILHDVASPAAASRPPDARARAAGLQQPYRACLSACGAAWNVTAADPRCSCALSLAVDPAAESQGSPQLPAPPTGRARSQPPSWQIWPEKSRPQSTPTRLLCSRFRARALRAREPSRLCRALCAARACCIVLNLPLRYTINYYSVPPHARAARRTQFSMRAPREPDAQRQTEMHDLLARHRCQACATRADCESPSILPGLPRGRDAPAEIWLSSTPARLRAMPCGRCTSSAPEINCDA